MSCPMRTLSASAFLLAAIAYYAVLVVTVREILTDNCSCYPSGHFALTSLELHVRLRFTKPYTPHTNNKTELFIQSALRE